ncbi:hypothetical protein V202x_24090 [Gimesia aquarii]|uniref:Uncharacterized protein n=1 Tax=Gimesia aquarii TaxID=2527964 RepID=A0A517WUY6_9PLAN|nr:hypothetical protein V202x_24090 [Gimesia aquarii]
MGRPAARHPYRFTLTLASRKIIPTPQHKTHQPHGLTRGSAPTNHV